MFRKPIAALGIAILSVALLGGCVNINTDKDDSRMQEMMGDSSNFSGDDLMFAQMMIPHHQQAIDMSDLALIAASDEKVKSLAEEIAAEQGPEIEQMKSWLDDQGASEHMGHSMGMNGMVSESDMAKLMESSGADFDKLFLELMIAHHKGAIEMSQMVLDSNNPEARALGRAIIESQTKQIAYMENLLSN